MRPARTSAALLGLVCVLAGSPGRSAASQGVFGTISGTVTDSSGAVLQDATVRVTNVDTSVTKTLTTNEAGAYTATNLIPGIYKVEGSRSGFKTAVISAITL